MYMYVMGSSLGGVGPVRGLKGGGRGGLCEECARPPKQPRMVRTFLKVHAA